MDMFSREVQKKRPHGNGVMVSPSVHMLLADRAHRAVLTIGNRITRQATPQLACSIQHSACHVKARGIGTLAYLACRCTSSWLFGGFGGRGRGELRRQRDRGAQHVGAVGQVQHAVALVDRKIG